jgi:hypothetical protein
MEEVVTIDDEFIENFSRNFAERATPVYQQMLDEKLAGNMKFVFISCWASGLLGMCFTMLITSMVVG